MLVNASDCIVAIRFTRKKFTEAGKSRSCPHARGSGTVPVAFFCVVMQKPLHGHMDGQPRYSVSIQKATGSRVVAQCCSHTPNSCSA